MTSFSDVPSLLEIWRQLLPSHVVVDAGALVERSDPLTHSELMSAGQTNDTRQREFEAGRFYAKRALSIFGLRDVDLPVGPDRFPAWPSGFIGSITHVQRNSTGQCAAAVARTSEVQAIGIDIESERGLDPRYWPSVLTPSELNQILEIPVIEREPEVIRRWCIKEAIAKAGRQISEPSEINIVTFPMQSDLCITASFTTKAPLTINPERYQVRSARAHGFIFATAVVSLQ